MTLKSANMNELSDRLRIAIEFLERNGYAKNDSAIARKLGVTPSTITMAKRGERVPTWGMLLDLCDYYPINFWWLRTGFGNMIKENREAALLARIEELERKISENCK